MKFRDRLWCLAHLRVTRIDRNKKYVLAFNEPLSPEMLESISTWITQPSVPLLIVHGTVQVVEGVVGMDTSADTSS